MSNLNNFQFNARVKNTNSHVGRQHFTFIEKEKQIRRCARCDSVNQIERHHVHPRRFFGRHTNVEVIFLCTLCHKQIELLIPKYEMLSREWYENFTKFFISNMEKI